MVEYSPAADVSTPPRAFEPWVPPLILLLFVGSGAAALIYEIVWLQLLQLVIGSSAVSLGVLLGTFMGGMCLGSLMLPRLVSARHHPLRVYALIELGIGIVGLLVLFLMPLVGVVYTAWGGYGFSGFLMRGIVAALVLLPPTFLMGLSFPYLPFEQAVLQALSELTATDVLGEGSEGDEREIEIADLTGKLVVMDHRIQDAERRPPTRTKKIRRSTSGC